MSSHHVHKPTPEVFNQKHAGLAPLALIGTSAVGIIISTMNGYYVFLKFAKLWQLQHAPPAASADRPGPV